MKIPFDEVSDRNDRNGKMPVIGLASPSQISNWCMPPLTPYRPASEIPASAYSLGGPGRALYGNLPFLTYGLPSEHALADISLAGR